MFGIHIRRQLPPPSPLGDAIRRFARLTVLDPSHGVDPLLAGRQRRTAGQLNPISSIATADGNLGLGRVGIDPKRRTWRYRAFEGERRRLVLDVLVESETAEGAAVEGSRIIKRDWRKLGLERVDAIVGSVLAV